MDKTEYGLLIDYEWCTGCYVCLIAGRNANNLDIDRACITISEEERMVDDRVLFDFMPMPTGDCGLCAPRTQRGLIPTCAHHCPPKIIKWGSRAELEKLKNKKPNQILFFPE
jgi:Fe-S-cluster-containing dehydrogenase component